MRCWIGAAAIFATVSGCAREPPPLTQGTAAGYKKDIEDQLGITRAKQTRERCSQLAKPAIGMTAAQVLASCWGKPDHVAETITARGKVAGWGSPEGNILLSDGVVMKIETIQ